MSEENVNPIVEFGEKHFELGSEASIPGPWRLENSPWMRGVFDALADPRTETVSAQFGAQMGKNLIAEIYCGYIIRHAPGNIIVYGATDDDAAHFFNERIAKRLEGLDVLNHVWPKEKGTLKKDGLFLPHMYILPMGANPSNTQSKSVRYIINDERHLWEQGMSRQAIDRTAAFSFSKIFNISTAADAGKDWDVDFSAGTHEVWHLGCPDCKKLVRMVWSKDSKVIHWVTDDNTKPDGIWNYQKMRNTVKFICPHEDCKAEFPDSRLVREEMNRLADYVPTNKGGHILNRSFQASQLAAPWIAWGELAEKFLLAMEDMKMGNNANLRNFVIKQLAETWENMISPEKTVQITGGYKLTENGLKKEFHWEDEFIRFMGVDVQDRGGRHFWAEVRAFSSDGRSRLVWPDRLDSWDDVAQMADSNNVPRKYVLVDAKFASQEVYENCMNYGFTWVRAEENRLSYNHLKKSGGKTVRIEKPYSEIKLADVLLGKTLGDKHRLREIARQTGARMIGNSINVQGVNFSKNWARETLHNCLTGSGLEWGLPSDITRFEWKGTTRDKTTYLKQMESWVPLQTANRNTGKESTIWKKIYADDHLRAVSEIILIGAAMMGLVSVATADNVDTVLDEKED